MNQTPVSLSPSRPLDSPPSPDDVALDADDPFAAALVSIEGTAVQFGILPLGSARTMVVASSPFD